MTLVIAKGYSQSAGDLGSNQLIEKSKVLGVKYQVDISPLQLDGISRFTKDSLRNRIANLVKPFYAKIGVSILHLESKDTLTYNGTARLPMLSVYKFPIALAVLSQVDKGDFAMDQQIQILKDLIHPDEEEIVSSNFPSGKASIENLLTQMLVYGSNTACDVLLDAIGGPKKVQRYIRRLGIDNIVIANTEKEIQLNKAVKYKNWSTANEMVKLLSIAYSQNILTTASFTFLWNKMSATMTGPDRLRGLLPKETIVAHRTGTSNNGYNDIGIIHLPNGKHLAVAVFISDAKGSIEYYNRLIAQIGKLAWDYYSWF